LAAQRRDLRKLAQTQPAGRWWLAFDNTWVESEDGSQLYQTQDAAQFFNAQHLSSGITGNRLLMAMPGILTAQGILGTFVGLQIGLSTLDLSSPQNLTQSIMPLIQASAMAFSTSVWGTVASVLFNILEKSVERALGKRIEQLQHAADGLFRQHLPEQTLINIERASRESEIALKGLAEQIGDRLQETLLEVPQQIQAGIEMSMAPAIERLVQAAEKLAEKQGNSSQDVLAKLVESFVGRVEESGHTSRQGLESASEQLSSAIARWSDGMEAFLGRLQHRAGEFDTQIGGLLEQGRELRSGSEVSQQALSDIAGEIKVGGSLLKQAAGNLDSFSQQIAQAARLLSDSQLQTAQLASETSKRQQTVTELLERIAQVLDQANQGLLLSSQRLQDSADTAKAGFDGINSAQQEFLENLKKTLAVLRKQVGQMMADYATDVEQQTRGRMEQWNAQTQEFSKGMVAAVNAMSEILGEIDSALAQRRS